MMVDLWFILVCAMFAAYVVLDGYDLGAGIIAPFVARTDRELSLIHIFFLESTFLYLFLFGEKRMSPRQHMAMAVLVMTGSWLSGYFIVTTNAFMQHPVGHSVGSDGVPVSYTHLDVYKRQHRG